MIRRLLHRRRVLWMLLLPLGVGLAAQPLPSRSASPSTSTSTSPAPAPAPAPAPPEDRRAVRLAADAEASNDDQPFEGRVAAYVLSPEAEVAGLLFDDGRQVSVPPHLGAKLAALIRPGQQARIGARRDDARGPGRTRAITSIATGETLVDRGRDDARVPPRAAGPAGSTLAPMRASGAIRLRLHGPRGETNGLLLDSGTQVFFPPHVANEAAAWLWPGNSIDVEGFGRSSAFGTVLQATRMTGPDGDVVNVYGPPDPAQKRR